MPSLLVSWVGSALTCWYYIGSKQSIHCQKSTGRVAVCRYIFGWRGVAAASNHTEHPLVHCSKYVIVSIPRSPEFYLVFWATNAQYDDVSLKGHHHYKAKIKIAVFDCDGYFYHNFSHLYYILRHLAQLKSIS